MADKTKKYSVNPEFVGMDVWTIRPEYDRTEGSKFTLSEKLSQKDLGFLYEVIHHPAITLE